MNFMRCKKFLLVFSFLGLIFPLLWAAESDQQINDFSLAGYGEKGKKTWDLTGKSADIFTDVVKLNDIIGNLYGEKEDINLKADKGDFNKADGNVHLEQNVVINTSSGARLTSDTLDWDRKNNIITTPDFVNIKRDYMVATAIGARGEPDMSKVNLEKKVRVEITPDDNTTVITCDGPMEVDYAKNIATFKNNVKVDRPDTQIYGDIMDLYFIKDAAAGDAPQESAFMGNKINKVVVRGNAKIVRGENISYSDEAIYTAEDKKIVLQGSPRLTIYSTEEFKSAPFGN